MPRSVAPTWETKLLLEVDGLDTAYGASQVLFGLSMEIREGECVTYLLHDHLRVGHGLVLCEGPRGLLRRTPRRLLR